jgi:hypothetical protein
MKTNQSHSFSQTHYFDHVVAKFWGCNEERQVVTQHMFCVTHKSKSTNPKCCWQRTTSSNRKLKKSLVFPKRSVTTCQQVQYLVVCSNIFVTVQREKQWFKLLLQITMNFDTQTINKHCQLSSVVVYLKYGWLKLWSRAFLEKLTLTQLFTIKHSRAQRDHRIFHAWKHHVLDTKVTCACRTHGIGDKSIK